MFNAINSIYDYPEYYEITSPGCPGDAEFYLEESKKSGEPVLEIGFGLGRIGIPIAQSGLNITGIDNSSFMFNEAQKRVKETDIEVQNNVHLVFSDIRYPKFDGKFKTIIMPYRVFLHLPNFDDQLRALSAIYELLSNDGSLILNIFDPNVDTLSQFTKLSPGSHRILRIGELRNSSEKLASWATTYCNLQNQLIQELWTYELIRDNQIIKRQYGLFEVRYVFRFEMENLLARSGFRTKTLYGDFDRSPYQYGREQIWVCTKR